MTEKKHPGKKPKPTRERTDPTLIARATDTGAKVAAVAAVALSNAPQPLAAAAVGLALASSITSGVQYLLQRFGQRQFEKAERLLSRFLQADSIDEKVRRIDQKLKDNPNFEEVLRRALRAQTEAVAEGVSEVLLALLVKYEKLGNVDAFFRGLCRILQELEQDEFDALGIFLAQCELRLPDVHSAPGGQGGIIEIRIKRPDGKLNVSLRATDGTEPVLLEMGGHDWLLRRVLKLFAANDLAFGGDVEPPNEWPVVWCLRADLYRLAALFPRKG
jgi:hypothetical protein